jgi:GTPase SAR1 family protein
MLKFSPLNAASQQSATNRLKYETTRLQLIQCLSETCSLPGADAASCNWLSKKLGDAAFNLVVVGQFKRGKSSLINALLGTTLLPTGVIPLTSAITTIKYGSEIRVRIKVRTAEFLEISPSSLEDYVTERCNPRNVKGVEEVIIEYPCAWLASGVRLIDTPGVESIYRHNSALTSSYVPQADAVVFVASVDQPFSQAELIFLRETAGYAGKVFCVLNKVDCLSPSELEESLAFCAAAIENSWGAPLPIFPLSARSILISEGTTAVDSLRLEEFRKFRTALEDFLFKDKDASWCRSIARTMGRILSQVRFHLELERSAAAAPLEKLDAAIGFLHAKREDTLRDQAEQLVILRAHVLRLLAQEIEPELNVFGAAQQSALAALLPSLLKSHANLPTKELHAALMERVRTEVRTVFDSWIGNTEPRLSSAVERLCNRFWYETQSRIDELLQRCGDWFQVSLAHVKAIPVWERDSRFAYKFWSEPTSLQILTSALLFTLPTSLVGPIVLKRLHRDAAELVQLHTGRLRADIEERLRRSIDDFGHQATVSTTFVLGQIEQALTRAGAAQRQGQKELTTRVRQINDSLHRVEALTAQVRELAT